MSKRIRIVSDLHIGHRASIIEKLEAIRPFAEDVDTIVFNGDTLELKYGDLDTSHYDAIKQRAYFDAEVAQWGVKVHLITGNHDPTISDVHSLSLVSGQVFITHGDGLFKEVAPWSSNVRNLRKCAEDIDENQTGSTEAELHHYLALHKKTSIQAHALDRKYNPTLWGRAKIFLHQAWPPSTPFRILQCWREVPDRAVSLTRRFGLTPRFIIVGHTHNPGIWRRGEQTVVNLGSYFPWPGARCVDIADGQLVVRKVSKRRHCIKLGPTVAAFDL